MKPRVLESIVVMAALLAPPFFATPLLAQRPVIVGQIVAKQSGIPVSYAVVGAKPAPSERFAGSDGGFTLRDVKPGKITVSARHIGYVSVDTTLDVGINDSLNLKLELPLVALYLPAVHALAERCLHPGDSSASVGHELSVLFDQLKQNADRIAYWRRATRSRPSSNENFRSPSRRSKRGSSRTTPSFGRAIEGGDTRRAT